MRMRRADGTFRWIESSAVPVHDQAAQPSASFRGLVGVSMDISDLVHAEQRLRETDQRKDKFLATLAHELRNPLAPISNAILILRMQTGADSRLASTRNHRAQVGHMSRMVDDLLDVCRVCRGKLELRKSRVNLQRPSRRRWRPAGRSWTASA